MSRPGSSSLAMACVERIAVMRSRRDPAAPLVVLLAHDDVVVRTFWRVSRFAGSTGARPIAGWRARNASAAAAAPQAV